MHAADRLAGGAQPHVHPRIEAASLAPLLERCGLVRPVVDVDRVRIAYPSLGRLVADLRAMGATNILRERPRGPVSRAFLTAAEDASPPARCDGKTFETVEILHFAAWRPADRRDKATRALTCPRHNSLTSPL